MLILEDAQDGQCWQKCGQHNGAAKSGFTLIGHKSLSVLLLLWLKS